MTAAVVLTRLLRDKLAVSMTTAQATQLWAECRAVLLHDLQIATIVGVENDPELESFVPQGLQGDLLFAVGKVFASEPWPRDDAPAECVEVFLVKVAAAVQERQYSFDS